MSYGSIMGFRTTLERASPRIPPPGTPELPRDTGGGTRGVNLVRPAFKQEVPGGVPWGGYPGGISRGARSKHHEQKNPMSSRPTKSSEDNHKSQSWALGSPGRWPLAWVLVRFAIYMMRLNERLLLLPLLLSPCFVLGSRCHSLGPAVGSSLDLLVVLSMLPQRFPQRCYPRGSPSRVPGQQRKSRRLGPCG